MPSTGSEPYIRKQALAPDAHSRSLADFVAPVDSGFEDYVGAFAVTAGLGARELVERLEAEKDDYHAIMTRALADRLAEAFAEGLHERVRREWYAHGERLSRDELVSGRFRGIRPAFGYPACPDHAPKRDLFEILDASAVGMGLTETLSMTPAASVSGIYLAHPEAKYFGIGRIGRDQLEDYANRAGASVEETEKALSALLR